MNKETTQHYALSMRHVHVRRGAFRMEVKELYIRPGEIACVVGANGSGKTTLLLTAMGLVPHEGICRIDGMYYDGTQVSLKARIGFIPDDPEILFEELTAREQWSVTASVLSRARKLSRTAYMEQAMAASAQLLFDPPSRLAREYSHGMRRKTQIVNAVLGSPSLLVIDELRNGLDPIAIMQAEQLIASERDRGAAILTATHDLWWAERFADYIYIMDGGRIVAAGTCPQLLQKNERSLQEAFCRIVGVRS